MKVFRSFEEFTSLSRHSALAIGNFDGLHLGHQKILKFLVRLAKRQKLLSCVLTFSPHPEKIFGPDKICMIQTLEQRLEGIEKIGVEATLVVPFNRRFANLRARDFVEKILVHSAAVRAVILGRNFRFGKKREGDIPALRRYGDAFGFEIHSIPQVKKNRTTVSSSLIRDLLERGSVEQAGALLGRAYEIEGDVIPGDRRGKSLGFPTANIQSPNEIIPRGVFLTLIGVQDKRRPALTNVGLRPTVGRNKLTIETYILNFKRTIYGEPVKIEFLKKLRDEQAFPTLPDLARQIQKDVEAAGGYFQGRGIFP